jgi:carbon storage regulator CsrA
MLILSRRQEETVTITTPDGFTITVMVCQILPSIVRLGFVAPREVQVVRDDAKKQTRG